MAITQRLYNIHWRMQLYIDGHFVHIFIIKLRIERNLIFPLSLYSSEHYLKIIPKIYKIKYFLIVIFLQRIYFYSISNNLN